MGRLNMKYKLIGDYVDVVKVKGKTRYQVTQYKSYYSKRYNKHICITPQDPTYDGATGARDIDSFGWLYHDVLCRDGCFSDGTKCNNWQASQVLSDILKEEGRWVRSKTWLWMTWLIGGGKARDNGMY